MKNIFLRLKNGSWKDGDTSANMLPYPFALASPIEDASGESGLAAIQSLGDAKDWAIKWKWDGIRGQWIYKDGNIAIWSRGEDLMTDRFPELILTDLPYKSLVLDGEILSWKLGDDKPLGFQSLQTRIGRKKLNPKVLESAPIRFFAYDCLELDGKDLRSLSLTERRKIFI